jgi:hypothetical protein
MEENNEVKEVVKQKSSSNKVIPNDEKGRSYVQPDSNVPKRSIPGEGPMDKELPVLSRLRKRLTIIKEQSSAKTVKYPMGSKSRFVTTPPKMHIVNLSPTLNSPTFGTISYGVYKTNDDGTKYIDEQYTEIDGKKRLINAQPVIEKTIVEYFEYRKEGYMEIFNEEQ